MIKTYEEYWAEFKAQWHGKQDYTMIKAWDEWLDKRLDEDVE